MRLTQIKLAGFKSFVDPTTIPVPSQLVGVVGPNGCGKSNIIDAVRWVLGESRASELRGESMQDVIFNGSGQRKAASRASVELVFDNDEGRAVGQWSSYAEISVRRILTRDGTSSYFINNQQVRRRDIHDVFLGTGLGSKGYAIIGQGMINRLIEAKPEELRVYLEEAAGVSRYKERRRETENRLADTRDNLNRVEDILSELTKQLRRLESQAEVAAKYKDLQQEGEQKQFAFWYLKEQAANAEQALKSSERQQAQASLEEGLTAFKQLEEELAVQRQRHYRAADELHQAQSALYETNAQVASIEAEIRHAADSRQRIEHNKQRLKQQIEEWKAQYAHCTSELEEIAAQLEESAFRFEESQARLEEAQDELPELEAKLSDFEWQREQLRLELSNLEQQQALLRQQQEGAERQLSHYGQRRQRLEQEQGALVSPEEAALVNLAEEYESAQTELEEVQAQLEELEAQLPMLEEQRGEARQQSQQAEQTLARLEARREALEKLQSAVMSDRELEPWLQQQGLESQTPLWQLIQLEGDWSVAVESILRERLSALSVESLDTLLSAEVETPPARLALYSQAPATESSASGSVSAKQATNTNWQPLLSVIRTSDARVQQLLEHWLSNIYLIDNYAEALSRRSQLPQLGAGACFVDKAGHVVDANGLYFYAADSEQSGMLARQQEIEDLAFEIEAATVVQEQQAINLAHAEDAWQALNESVPPLRQRVVDASRVVHERQLAFKQLEQQIQQASALHQRLHQDLAELTSQEEEAAARIEEAAMALESNQISLEEGRERYREVCEQLEAIGIQVREIRQRVQTAERANTELAYERRSLDARADELKRNQQLSEQQSAQAQSELENLEGELFVFDEQSIQGSLSEVIAARQDKEEILGAKREELERIEQRLKEQDEQRLQLEMSIEPRRQAITQLQLDEQAARLTAEQFAEQLDQQEVERDTIEAYIAASEELSQLNTAEERVKWLQDEIQRLSRAIERLGSVNLAALEELEEARERKGFLDAQQADLQEAMNTLEEAIRNIDKETRHLLSETFELVNGHFGELFPRLFGGGQAKLVMTGEEILDAGVQVMAQPPGKRNSTIHLLSGGEKALTATALVFALFKLNPAPFCLLDEVDAPLDDANTERYARLVESMSDQTQFLFISHNKIAMQMAKQLVGVTMQEQGVSRIVAVDIDAAVEMMDA